MIKVTKKNKGPALSALGLLEYGDFFLYQGNPYVLVGALDRNEDLLCFRFTENQDAGCAALSANIPVRFLEPENFHLHLEILL